MRIISFILSLIISTFSFLPQIKDDMKVDAIQKEMPGDAYSFSDENGVSIHDPSLFKSKDGTYYAYGTHITTAKSTDLINWQTISSGVCDNNRLLVPEGKTLRRALAEPFSWCDAAQVQWGTPENEWQTNVWAPSVVYNKIMRKYCYYGSTSLFGTPNSVIWMAVSESPEGPFIYKDCLLYSGFNKHISEGEIMYPTHYKYTNLGELQKTLVYTKKQIEKQTWFTPWDAYDNSYGKAPNCIDPAVFYDEKGNLWMTYGSYSGGTYIVPLCETTGMPDFFKMKRTKGYDMYFGKKLVSTNETNEGSGEGPFILYDKETDYYYLFLTYGFLDAAGGYNIRQYRSKNPDGPYVDIKGQDGNLAVNTGLKISGNYGFTDEGEVYLSSGHSSYLTDSDSRIFEAFHTRYNTEHPGYFNMKIHQMVRTKSGWLTPLPLSYKGEKVEKNGYDEGLLYGEWEIVDLSSGTIKAGVANGATDFDSSVSPTQKVTFTEKGEIKGFTDYTPSAFNAKENGKATEGNFKYEKGTEFLTITLGDVEYDGVLCEMTGEKGKKYIALSAVGSDNSTLLGLKEIF